MTFLDGVNRLLRILQIIQGDDDALTTFDDSQHAADIQLAQIAIQDELAYLVADELIDYEKTSGTITLVSGTRSYQLATDFIRFYGTNASFYDSLGNQRIYELPGGEDSLRDADYQYKTNTGSPDTWYWDSTTSKKVAFYSVPDDSYNGIQLQYDYEKSVAVTAATDTLPFQNDQEGYAFIGCAARRFKTMDGSLAIQRLEDDPVYLTAKTTLMGLMRPTNAPKQYGRQY